MKKRSRITLPGPVTVQMPLVIDSQGRVRFIYPVLPQPKELLRDELANLLRVELKLKKADALTLADKALDIIADYGYTFSERP